MRQEIQPHQRVVPLARTGADGLDARMRVRPSRTFFFENSASGGEVDRQPARLEPGGLCLA